MKKITPFLWFDANAEEAMNFYVSVFKNSTIGSVSRYGEAGPGPKGTVMSATFQLDGQDFMALNGGPHFTFTPAIDRYGLSWQIIPSALGKLLQDKDPRKASRVMNAMMQMTKIDITRLKEAYDQG